PDEATVAEVYRDDDRTQVEARTRSTFGMVTSAPSTVPNATTLRMDRSPDSARTIARANPAPESARTIARANPAPESARTAARATPPVVPPAPTTLPQLPASKPVKAAPSARDVSREAGAAAAGASLGSVLADKYRVDRVIGRGGMSYVIEGTHVQLGQKVA